MLELQSLQKEQKRRDLLQMIQKEEMNSADVTVPLRKVINSSDCGGSTNQTDEIRLNNNRDTIHFDNDGNDDDMSTTVADDIVLMKSEANNDSMLNHTNTLVRDNSSSKVTVRQLKIVSFHLILP